MGFGLGIERLLLVLEQSGLEIPQPVLCDLYIAVMGQEAKHTAFKLVDALRRAGIKAETDHAGRSVKAQFKYADKLQARYVVTIGESELASGEVRIRNMGDGSETQVKISEIINFFNK